MILFRVAAAVYFLTHLLVAAAPVVVLASFVAVSQMTSNASRRVVGQWFGAGGAGCEDHFCLVRALGGFARRELGVAGFLVSYMTLATCRATKTLSPARISAGTEAQQRRWTLHQYNTPSHAVAELA